MDPPKLDKNEIESLVGTKISNIDLYQKAFTHKSALKDYNVNDSFETLEFIGDSVLGFVITKFLFDRFEKEQEGFLTKARTKLVRGDTLAMIASKLGLDRFILMDEKGMRNNWNKNPKVLEDAFEALVGAIYVDNGLVHAKKFILGIFEDPNLINMDIIRVDDNFKDHLMRYCQTNKLSMPEYKVLDNSNGIFTVYVYVDGETLGYGMGKNKKQAEHAAAKKFFYPSSI